MDGKRKVRQKEQEEIDTIVNEHMNISNVIHHTMEDIEETIGFTWTNLAHIYFEDDATIQTVYMVRDELKEAGYLAVIEEEDGSQISINVETTMDTFEKHSE